MNKISRKLKKQLKNDVPNIENVFALSALSAKVSELDFFNESFVSYYVELTIGTKVNSVIKLKEKIASALGLNPNLISMRPIYERGLIEISVPKSIYLKNIRLRKNIK